MAAAADFFIGMDSYGRSTHVAIRAADGTHFYRYYRGSGYGRGWLKWTKIEPGRIVADRYEWGFRWLDRADPNALRLPEAA